MEATAQTTTPKSDHHGCVEPESQIDRNRGDGSGRTNNDDDVMATPVRPA